MAALTLTIVTGGGGSGKTLLCVITARKYIEGGGTVYANFSLSGAQNLDLERLLRGQYSRCLVLIDEAYAYLESRLSGRPLNRACSYILFQSRKLGLHIMMTAQMLMTVDVRFRTLMDVWVSARAVRPGFEYWFYQASTGRARRLVLPWRVAERYFDLYDTYELVEPADQVEIVDRLFLEPDEILDRAEKFLPAARRFLAEQGLPVTVDTSELACRAVGAPQQCWRVIYLRLKAEERKEKEGKKGGKKRK